MRCAPRAVLGALLLASVALLTPSAPGPAAQEVLGIAAVVNDEPVSAFDLEQRLRLIIRSSDLPDNRTTRRRLAPRVLQSLIDETLQLQEAERLNITVSDKEIEEALGRLEQQNGLPDGGLDRFLEERGIGRATLERQARAALAWRKVVSRRFGGTINVTDEEIDSTLARLEENANKPRHLVSEIFLAVDNPAEEDEVRRNARRIYQELKRGASFSLLAQQFSESASAEKGGDLGWVQPGQLDPKIDKVLAELPVGALASPIRTARGYAIVGLRDRRPPPAQDAGDTVVSLRQVVIPTPADASPRETESQLELARTIAETARGCADFEAVSDELGSKLSGNLGRLKVRELPEPIRKVVTDIEIGVPSEPLRLGDGIRVLMVCDRKEPSVRLPGREKVRQLLANRELSELARCYLRDLRQDALVDVRV